MTSKVFYCSKQRAMHLAQEVLRELKLNDAQVNSTGNSIQVERGWSFLSPPTGVEITIFPEDKRVEVAVSVESKVKMLDFGRSEYLEEEILYRLKERMS
ncbi:MAG: hypothetical protein RL040_1074 [Bacteroidota bacterium]|jgi:hypothetical protein